MRSGNRAAAWALAAFLLTILSPALAAPPEGVLPIGPKPPGEYYVMAPSGLILRAAAARDSDKLGQAARGDKIRVVEPAKAADLVIDGLPGGMARVEWTGPGGGVPGWMFDGYLARLPPAAERRAAEAYAERLRTAGFQVLFEQIRRDWGGYIQAEEALTIRNVSWTEAYLAARELFDMPRDFKFPPLTGKENAIQPNPQPIPNAWTDEMTAEYGEDGSLKAIRNSFRTEGGGRAISIELPEESKEQGQEMGLRIGELQIAD